MCRTPIAPGLLLFGLAVLFGAAFLLRPARPQPRATSGREAPNVSVAFAEAAVPASLHAEQRPGQGEGAVATAQPGMGGPMEAPAEDVESPEALSEDAGCDAFWGSLDELGSRRESVGEGEYREEALRLTAEFLGFDRATAQAFGQAQSEAQVELDRLQQGMGAMFVGVPDELSEDDLVRTQCEAEERFRADREAALARMETFLDASPRHQWFRDRLGQWMGYFAASDR